MSFLVSAFVVLMVFAAVMGGLAWLTSRQRGRRAGGSVAGPFEEIWHPAAHRARVQIEVYDERKIPMPSPGDPLIPVTSNEPEPKRLP